MNIYQGKSVNQRNNSVNLHIGLAAGAPGNNAHYRNDLPGLHFASHWFTLLLPDFVLADIGNSRILTEFMDNIRPLRIDSEQ